MLTKLTRAKTTKTDKQGRPRIASLDEVADIPDPESERAILLSEIAIEEARVTVSLCQLATLWGQDPADVLDVIGTPPPGKTLGEQIKALLKEG